VKARSAAAALGALAGAVAALWLRFNAAPGGIGEVFPYDLLHYYLPMTELAAERLASGELPLWNSHSCSGIPLLATLQVGVFYPPTWLALALPAEDALQIRVLLETALAGAFAAGLFRRWGGSWSAGSLGGLLYVFACVLGQSFWPPSLSTLVWLPPILACVDSLCRGWSPGWWVLLVGCGALQLVAGFPQFAVYTWYLAGPWAAVRLASVWWEGAVSWSTAARRAAALAFGILLAAGVASIQLFPSLELVGESQRIAPLSREQVHYRRAEVPLSPRAALANAVDPRPKLVSLGYGSGAGYLGIPTLLLVALGVVAGWRHARTWLLIGLGSLALMLSGGYVGPAPGLYALFAALPTGGMFRDPERLRLVTLFCAITLAVVGFGHLHHGLRGAGARRRAVSLAVVALAAAGIAVAGASGAAIRALGGSALVLLAMAWRDSPRRRGAATALLVALIAADVFVATQPGAGSLRDVPVEWSRNLTAGGRVFVDPERGAALARDAGVTRLAFPNLRPDLASGPLRHLNRVSCLEPLAPSQWPDLHERLSGRPPTAGTLSGLPLERTQRLLDLAGVSTLVLADVAPGVSSAPVPTLGPAPRSDLPIGMGTRVVPNPNALQRARLVHEVRIMSQHAALGAVAEGGIDLRRTVWLERPPEPVLRGVDPAPDGGAAEILAYEPERVTVAVRGNRDAMLVLSDTYYPGWSARVDGAEVEILRAYGLYRAVRVPAGEHVVEFRYRPASLMGGGVASGLSLLATALVGWAAPRRRASGQRRASRDVEARVAGASRATP
jgi:hypothetical protein